MDKKGTETEGDCPVSMDILGKLYRANPAQIGEIIGDYSQNKRARLALFCYARQHLRSVGLSIAVHCDVGGLVLLAGETGLVFARQARENISRFGSSDVRQIPQRAKISLGGARAA